MRERADAISRFLGQAARDVALARNIEFLFVSGGDTAARVVPALGAEHVDFSEELMPGLPFGSFASSALGRKLHFASKSGGFGPPEALVEVLLKLERGSLGAPRKDVA